MGIADVTSELYGLPPTEFTAARNAAAKEARASGDRELAAAVQALRKPTAGAWLLNQLVRRNGAEVQQVLELGGRLRAAQGTLGASELRALDGQRRALTRAVAHQAVAIGRETGRTVSAQVAADVEESLRSAMVDPEAGAALASGMLTDTFRSTGLEAVDLSRVVALHQGAVARPGPPAAAAASADERDEAAVVHARERLEQAEEAVRAAAEEAQGARRAAVSARRHREDLQAELDEVRRHVADLEAGVAEATEAEDAGRRAQVAATRGERSAIEVVERARRRVRALGGSDAPA